MGGMLILIEEFRSLERQVACVLNLNGFLIVEWIRRMHMGVARAYSRDESAARSDKWPKGSVNAST